MLYFFIQYILNQDNLEVIEWIENVVQVCQYNNSLNMLKLFFPHKMLFGLI